MQTEAMTERINPRGTKKQRVTKQMILLVLEHNTKWPAKEVEALYKKLVEWYFKKKFRPFLEDMQTANLVDVVKEYSEDLIAEKQKRKEQNAKRK